MSLMLKRSTLLNFLLFILPVLEHLSLPTKQCTSMNFALVHSPKPYSDDTPGPAASRELKSRYMVRSTFRYGPTY
eukprot:16437319-Heterocapsa_arctica.AAC.1